MLGDAVHAMVPYMSQGAAAAIEDAAALALLLSEHGRQSLPDLMAGFESLRKGRSAEIQRRSALNGRVWHCKFLCRSHCSLRKSWKADVWRNVCRLGWT